MHSVAGTLEAVEPFDFKKSLAFLAGFGPMSGQQGLDGSSVTKAIIVDGQTVAFRVKGQRSELGYELFSREPLSAKTVAELEGRISFFLSLEDDLKPFYSLVKEKDPEFYPLVEMAWGLHHVKFLTFPEIACWAVINQRIQRPVALKIKQAITERFGDKLEVGGKEYWAFPDQARLKAAKPRELLEATKNERITKRISSLASLFDELDEGFLRTALYEKAKERLEKVYGIGEWSSMFILYRGFGRMGRLQPINVRPLQGEIKGLYESVKPLKEIDEVYGAWAGYWQLYLWASRMDGFKSP